MNSILDSMQHISLVTSLNRLYKLNLFLSVSLGIFMNLLATLLTVLIQSLVNSQIHIVMETNVSDNFGIEQ